MEPEKELGTYEKLLFWVIFSITPQTKLEVEYIKLVALQISVI